jgi:hypothetical protein
VSAERPVDPAPAEPRAPLVRRQPGALELLRWSAILLGVSLLVAAIAIPLLRWLGLGT